LNTLSLQAAVLVGEQQIFPEAGVLAVLEQALHLFLLA